jgi:CRP/FNR family transcriptional regulator, cyclic AMP receptor protein
MIQNAPASDLFKLQLRTSFELETTNSSAKDFAKNATVYACGDQSDSVYFIESGQIKLTMSSPNGKECLLAIHTAGDVFGETCLSGRVGRRETATAMRQTVVKQISCSKFFSRLVNDSLLEGFVKYLAVRISDQQDVISNLMTVDSEQRLGKTLLLLAGRLGEQDRHSAIIRQKITHDELSKMVGTTRPRIGAFLGKFRELNLISLGANGFIIVEVDKLSAYLEQTK